MKVMSDSPGLVDFAVSNVCEAALKSLFWVPSGLDELPEMCFEFPFNLIGKLTTAFLTGQS